MGEALGAVADGRRQRGERNRQAIVDAALELIEAGILVPTAQQISDRAGVSKRTVFRHFSDMDSLFAAIDDSCREKLESLFRTEIPQGSLKYRLAKAVEHRAYVYERVWNLTLSTQALFWRSDFVSRHYAANQRRLRRELEKRLPEVRSLDRRRRESVDAIISFEMWHRLRFHQGLGRKASMEQVRDLLDSLLV